MNTYVDKNRDDKGQSIASKTAQQEGRREAVFSFLDRRPETVAQNRLQEMANHNPHLKQLRVVQEMAKHSAQSGQVTQLKAMADVIQGYFSVPSGAAGYNPAVGAVFESQSKVNNVSARTDKTILAGNQTSTQQQTLGGAGFAPAGAAVVNAGVPDLNVSAGSELAIESNVDEPRNYFSTAAALATTNSRLRDVNSSVRLHSTGQTVDVPTNADPVHYDPTPKTLNKIKVDPAIEPTGDLAAFFSTHECNSFVKKIIGETERVAVIGTGLHAREVDAPGEREPFNAVADYVSHTPQAAQTPANLEAAMTTNTPALNAQSDYNTMNKAHVDPSLGINAAASPEIGEGYVIKPLKNDIDQERMNQMQNVADRFSRPGGTDASDQYLQALNQLQATNQALDVKLQGLSVKAQSLKHLWIYHYAGVVAKDGGDTITLENFNRAQEKKWNISNAFNTLFAAQQAFRDFVWGATTHLTAQDFTQQRQLINNVQARGAAVNGALQALYDQARDEVNAAIGPINEMIHFKMYGDRPGQTFHEKWQFSTANQITLRIRQSLEQTKATILGNSIPVRFKYDAAFRIDCPDPAVAQRLRIHRIIVDGRLSGLQQSIVHAATIYDVQQATDSINNEKNLALAELQHSLGLLIPGIAPAADLAALAAQIQGEINNNPIGLRIRGRRQARDLNDSLSALHACATAVNGIPKL